MHARNMWRNRYFKSNKRDKLAREKYTYWRNEVVKCNNNSIQTYFDTKCNNNAGSKTFFKTISPYLSEKRVGFGSSILLHERNNVVSDSCEVAEIFSAYYKSIAEYDNISDSLEDLSLDIVINKHSAHPSICQISNKGINKNFDFSLINSNMVLKSIDSLVINKAPGYDGLQSKFLKLSGIAICDPLCTIFNECIMQSQFPSIMKLSEVSPVFKKDDPLCKENYRSVNLLTMFSKVFERLIAEQLTNYFLELLSPQLSAYRKGYNCQHVILKLTEYWRLALDNNNFVGTVSTDLSKAFDKMPHGLLIAKLHAYGLSPSACRLIMTYLCDRLQRVQIAGVVSDWATINRGVPQGSVLGPLLFNIFLNDMFYVKMSAEIINYADDNNLVDENNNLDDLKSNLAQDTKKTISWFNSNGLEANPSKFQGIVMNRNGLVKTSLSVNENTLESNEIIKVLGVTLDARLSFTPHITILCARASRQINALRRISRFLNVKSRLPIYKAFFLLILPISQ